MPDHNVVRWTDDYVFKLRRFDSAPPAPGSSDGSRSPRWWTLDSWVLRESLGGTVL